MADDSGEGQSGEMADHPNGEWLADPEGRHEYRYFVHGQPTDLVSDSGTETVDDHAEWRPDPSGRDESRYFVQGEATGVVTDAGVQSLDEADAEGPTGVRRPNRPILWAVLGVVVLVVGALIILAAVFISAPGDESVSTTSAPRSNPLMPTVEDVYGDRSGPGTDPSEVFGEPVPCRPQPECGHIPTTTQVENGSYTEYKLGNAQGLLMSMQQDGCLSPIVPIEPCGFDILIDQALFDEYVDDLSAAWYDPGFWQYEGPPQGDQAELAEPTLQSLEQVASAAHAVGGTCEATCDFGPLVVAAQEFLGLVEQWDLEA